MRTMAEEECLCWPLRCAPLCMHRQWVPAWSCGVLFSDSAAGFAVAKQATERAAELQARADALSERLVSTAAACKVRGGTHCWNLHPSSSHPTAYWPCSFWSSPCQHWSAVLHLPPACRVALCSHKSCMLFLSA